MEIVLVGFLIALAIGLTGVGAGIITAPVLMMVFHVPAAAAVGTALTFGAVTKLAIAPAYALRGQVNGRALAHMLAGGLPGVLAGSIILSRLDATRHQGTISLILGCTIVVFALLSMYRLIRPADEGAQSDRPWWLTAVSLPIGAEVGFSSAGSGSLASLALMGFTKLSTGAVVGTDIAFGLGLSLVGGSILIVSGHVDPHILPQLLAGGILGALTAPNLARIIPGRPLRIGLLIWIIFLGTQLIEKGFAH